MISRAEKQKKRVSYNCQWFSYFTCRWCLWLFQSTLWRICHTICSNQGYKMHKPGLRPLLLRVRRSLDTLLNTKSCEKDPHAWQFEGSILVVGPLISIPTKRAVSQELNSSGILGKIFHLESYLLLWCPSSLYELLLQDPMRRNLLASVNIHQCHVLKLVWLVCLLGEL